MTKKNFNSLLRTFVKENLSPTNAEMNFVSKIYETIQKAIGSNCFLSGSFARFTVIRPLHDLDILYISGKFNVHEINPQKILNELKNIIENRFINPTELNLKITIQSHSITMVFFDGKNEKFAIDIVPAFTSGDKNEYGDDIYFVPEILNVVHSKRSLLYEELSKTKKNEREWWIKSDPKGYIRIASDLNKINKDFRKAVKFVKRWKYNCKQLKEEFKLKSFHIEQVLTEYIKKNTEHEIFDIIFYFFQKLPNIIEKAQIPDRADSDKLIDDYIDDLTFDQKRLIIQARDCFLIKLEEIDESSSVTDLISACFYSRHSDSESFLFDYGIPMLPDPQFSFKIDGYIKPLDGYSAGWLSETPQLQKGLTRGEGKTRYINFRISQDNVKADLYKWKVKNDNSCPQPRGEITDHRTLRDPESTAYAGNHYVECYAIKNNICIARAKRRVNIL